MRFFATIFSRRGRAARGAVFAAAALALALPLDTAQAGFFDFLFAPPPFAPNPYQGYPGAMAPHWRGPHLHRHRPKIVERRRHRIAAIEKTQRGALTHIASTGIMDDKSLQEGDAVMTQRGIRIFTGSSNAHHSPDDFAKLSEIKGLPGRARAALAAIDANRSESGDLAPRQQGVLTGRSAADPRLSAGAMIADPKGRMIRYVGP